MDSNFEKLKEIIAEVIDAVPEDLDFTEKTTLEEIGLSSLDGVEVTMSIEDEFRVEIPEEVAVEFKSIGDILQYIDENTDY